MVLSSSARCLAFVATLAAGAAAQAADEPTQTTPAPGSEETSARRLSIQPGLQLEAAQFLQDNSWFGQSQANIGADSAGWTEVVATPSVDWRYALANGSSIYGRTSAIGAFTNGVDAAGSNVDSPRVTDVELEDSYLGWRSGDVLKDSLGENALDVSVGRRKYQVGSGFLFWKEANNGASRAANGIAPRKAARFAATGTLSTHGWKVDAVYLKFNDRPSTHTRLTGADFSYTSPAWGQIGWGVYKVLGSNKKTRSGMEVYNLRADTHPIPQFRGLRLAIEYVREENGGLLSAYAGFAGIGYTFDAPWSPYIEYQRALFSGDKPTTKISEAYDPFSLGISNWGSALIGKYVRSDTNMRVDSARIIVNPARSLQLKLEGYKMSLDQPPVGSPDRHYADELDLMASWGVTRRLTLSLTGAVAQPEAAAQLQTKGDKLWSYLMLDAVTKF